MATIKHVYSSPKADGADTSLVRPSDWNSAHIFTIQEAVSLSGNTAGVLADISSGTLYLAGGNNITLSQNANSVTVSGGDTSQFLTTAMASNRGSDFVQATAVFNGTNASGTIASNAISISVGAGGGDSTGGLTDFLYLDRAELDAQPGDYIFAGSNITISESPTADAISIFAPDTTQFLTTAMASNAGSQWVYTSAGLNLTSISATLASNSISLSVGPYITTARASTDAIGLNTAQTNVTWTVNSSGISLNAGGYAGIGFTSTTIAGTEIEATNNTAGLSMAVPNWLTTAMVSNAGSQWVYTTAGLNLTSISATLASNSISLSVGPYITTAMASNRGSDFVQANATIAGTNVTGTIASNVISLSVADAGAATDLGTVDRAELDALPGEYIFAGSNITISESPTANAISIFAPDTTQFLTTAMASDAGNRFVNTSAGLNLTSISATFNSNSISLSIGPYITTAMASNRGSDFVQATAAFAGTNASGTIASGGISVSVQAPSGATLNVSAGTTSGNLTQLVFSDSNGATWGLDGSTLTVSVAGGADTATWDRAELDALPGDYIFAGSNITISESPTADAISIFAPDTTQFLTTAMASNAGSNFVNTSAGLNLTSISATFNSNSISLSIGPYLTTARASTDAIGLNTAQTNVTWTVNSSGLSLNAGRYAGTGFSSTSTAGVSFVATLNTAGLSIGFPVVITAVRIMDDSGISFAGSNFDLGDRNQGVNLYNDLIAGDIRASLDPGGMWEQGENVPQPWEYIFAGSNITLSESPTGDAITIVGPTPGGGGSINFSAGTTSNNLDSVIFSNSGGISFGINGSTITATVATNYLTTARASTDAVGLNTAQTNVTWTVNSSGISIDAGGYAGTGFTSTTTAGTEIDVTNNTAGFSMAVPNWLTTAMASNAGSQWVYTTAGLNLTSISATLASNSISLSVGPYITTAMASNRGTDFVQATATFTGTGAIGTIASDGISVSVSDQTSNLTTDYLDRMELDAQPWEYIFAGSNITISESPNGEAITLVGPTNYLTTAMVSDAGSRFVNTSAGLNLTSISATFNSNSISLSVGAYITTAMASNRGTDFVQATAAFNGTNASGTIASGAISVSVANRFAAGVSTMGDTAGNTGTSASGTLFFQGSNSLTLSVSTGAGAQTIVFQPFLRALSAGAGISLSTNGSTIVIMTV